MFQVSLIRPEADGQADGKAHFGDPTVIFNEVLGFFVCLFFF